MKELSGWQLDTRAMCEKAQRAIADNSRFLAQLQAICGKQKGGHAWRKTTAKCGPVVLRYHRCRCCGASTLKGAQ